MSNIFPGESLNGVMDFHWQCPSPSNFCKNVRKNSVNYDSFIDDLEPWASCSWDLTSLGCGGWVGFPSSVGPSQEQTQFRGPMWLPPSAGWQVPEFQGPKIKEAPPPPVAIELQLKMPRKNSRLLDRSPWSWMDWWWMTGWTKPTNRRKSAPHYKPK